MRANFPFAVIFLLSLFIAALGHAVNAPNVQVTLDRTGHGTLTIFSTLESETCYAVGGVRHTQDSIASPAGQYQTFGEPTKFRPTVGADFYSDATLFFAFYLLDHTRKPLALQIYGSPALLDVRQQRKNLAEVPNTHGDIATEPHCAAKLHATPTPQQIKIVYE